MPFPPDKFFLPGLEEESNEAGEEVGGREEDEDKKEEARLADLEEIAAACLKEYYLRKEGIVPDWLND